MNGDRMTGVCIGFEMLKKEQGIDADEYG